MALVAAAVIHAPQAVADVPLTQGFEDGAPGWSMTGRWHVEQVGGSHVAWFGNPLVGHGALTSPSFSLLGQRSAFLQFSASWDVDPRDLWAVQVSDDGGETWKLLCAPKLRLSGGWRDFKIDLGRAAGAEAVRVRFVYATFTHLFDTHQGLQIDNVAITDYGGQVITNPAGVFSDDEPTVAIGAPNLVRDGDTFSVQFDINLSHAATHDVVVPWTVTGASGAASAAGSTTIPAGQTSAHVVLPVSGLDSPYAVGLPSGVTATTPSLLEVLGVRIAAGSGPVLGKTFVLSALSGTIRYHLPGGPYLTLGSQPVTLPVGSVVDSSAGHALVGVESDTRHTLQNAEIWDGKTGVFQSVSNPTTDLRLAGGDFSSCANGARKRSRSSATRRVRNLWASGVGHFRTTGRYASATVRGTTWQTEDLCSATRITVTEGVVAVMDFRRKRVVPVPAGKTVTIEASRSARFRRRSGAHPPRLSAVTRRH